MPLDFLSFLTEALISGGVTLCRFRKLWISEWHDIMFFRKPWIFCMSDMRKAEVSPAELEDFGFLLSVTPSKNEGFASKTAFLLFPAGLTQLRLNVIPL